MTKLQDGRYKLILYAESVGKSVMVFTTLECAKAIDSYLEERKREGDNLSPESPLIRKEFSWRDANKFEPVSRNTIARLVEQAAMRAGIRSRSGGKRHEMMLVHVFRKHFNTSLKRARVDNGVRKMLRGHDIGLDKNYMRLTEEEILAEYVKAEEELTISEEPKLRQEVDRLTIANADVNVLKVTVARQSEELDMMRRVLEQVTKGGINPTPKRTVEEENEYLQWLVEEREKAMAA